MPNVMHEYLKLDFDFDLDFFSLFHCKLDERFSEQPFNPSFGSKSIFFCTELGLSVPFDLYTLLS